MNAIFKALADPTRRQILRLLRQGGERTAGDLAEQLPRAKATISHHFAVLKAADLIAARRDGVQIYYTLNTTVVQELLGAVWDLLAPASSADPDGPKEAKS